MPEAPHYGTQTKARKAALDVLFAAELRGVGLVDLLNQQLTFEGKTVRELTTSIVHGVAEHREEIDARISAAVSDSWTLERMPAVDRNLARIAVFELDHTQVPASVAIAEAVRLASDLSTDESPTFLNGLLSRVAATSPKPTEN
ncbi:transcription antitermination factor NusB [Tessaracoccus sp. OS52]|uniref:transcription antitermination factor NusB n=1 Tax=Tessaracoccus sp. OS52 TaxID=2886691 RepID=UPI001D0FBEAC|nr:transcription antitermination factor NusB [Tessaracoccus sp. OS52]